MANAIRQRILKEVVRLYSDESNEKITVALICKAAGIQRSTFYYHFRGLEDIVESLEEIMSDTLSESMTRVLSYSTCKEQILELFACMHDDINSFGVGLTTQRKIFLLEKKDAEVFPKGQPGYDMVMAILNRASENGELRDGTDVFSVASCLFYISRGICESWLISNGAFDLHAEGGKHLKMMLDLHFLV